MDRDKKEAGSTLKGCGCNPGQRHWCDRCDIMRMVAAGWLAEGLEKGSRKEGPGFLQIQGPKRLIR